MPSIYTWGYGRIKRSEFESIVGGFPFQVIFDVRREGSRSRNGKWCWQGDLYMGLALDFLKKQYVPVPELANPFDMTKRGQLLYRTRLSNKLDWIQAVCLHIMNLATKKESVCLLCSERAPFTPSGLPACHRVILADVLAMALGDDWQVEHLGV